MANETNLSFEGLENRGKYTKILRKYFNNNGIESWHISPSVKTQEIFIQPKDYNELIWEKFPTISRISVQTNPDGKPSFGVSGYNEFQIINTKNQFEEKGYRYHQHIDRRGKKGRWWLIKTLDNLESLAGELKDIEHLLYEISKI